MASLLQPCYKSRTAEFAERAKGGKTPTIHLLEIDLTNSSPEEDVPPAAAATTSTVATMFKQHSHQFGEEVSSEEEAYIAAARFKHKHN